MTTPPVPPVPSHIPELLAPAGSPEAFRAAVAAGADAVYLSGKHFGARSYAANFSDQEMEEAIRYAHARDVSVYVTVNTLIHDRELRGVLEYLARLYGMGVDAVLVQDSGIAALAKELLPGLTLHASTQLTIHNTDGVRWAAEHGFSRVVLARELSLAEVSRIAGDTKGLRVGLEVFAHGALCYGYSGQCLLSSVIGGRSGNRGMCAQPCRKPYELVCGERDRFGRPGQPDAVPLAGDYLLSPKDLCTYRQLPELASSPVVSLKIEGRMKSPEYVAIVVSTYRKALDAIAAGRWQEDETAFFDLLLAFNRGFTSGYLFGDAGDALMGRDGAGHRGLPVGTVLRFDPKTSRATIRRDVQVTPVPGDGLLLTPAAASEAAWGFALNTRPAPERDGYSFVVPRPVTAGTHLSITSSRDLEARARQIIAKPTPRLRPPLPIDLELTIAGDGALLAKGTILRKNRPAVPFTFRSDIRMEPAHTHAVMASQIEDQFRKSGGTPFAIRRFTLSYDGHQFAPLATINAMRRELFRYVEECLVQAFVPSQDEVVRARRALSAGSPGRRAGNGDEVVPVSLGLIICTDTTDGIHAAAGAGADEVCFEPFITSPEHRCNAGPPGRFADEILAGLNACTSVGCRFSWKIPRIAHDTVIDRILAALPALHAAGVTACMVENPGTARALLREVPALTLSGFTGLNIFNHTAVQGTGSSFALLTLSPELSREECRDLAACAHTGGHPALALVVQGTSESMITEDCIGQLLSSSCQPGGSTGRDGFLGIRDETGRIFPVRTDGDCRTRIGNAAELCLIDHLPSIRAMQIHTVIVDARGRPSAYTQRMTEIYRFAIDLTNRGAPGTVPKELVSLKDEVKEIALGGITSGHFLRGLKEE
jgi:U32 family peptidase